MIDEQGYRLNVGIMLCNDKGHLLWARRVGRDGWQFPQGGIQPNETPRQALYRELTEEIGLGREDVEIIGSTRDWLHYKLPKRLIRAGKKPLCIGQKQIWFLLRLISSEQRVSLDHSDNPEFDKWCWIDHQDAAARVVAFKRDVYKMAIEELSPLLKQHTGYCALAPAVGSAAK